MATRRNRAEACGGAEISKVGDRVRRAMPRPATAHALDVGRLPAVAFGSDVDVEAIDMTTDDCRAVAVSTSLSAAAATVDGRRHG